MDPGIRAAIEYIPSWIEFQMRQHQQPGCSIAITVDGRVVLEQAFGYANLANRDPLTARHRFRVASHSKTFTAAGVMKLRDQDKLGLDDPIGMYVQSLPGAISKRTISQCLSHTAGLVRDGPDAGQWAGRIPFRSREQIFADLAAGLTIEPGTRFKYSNHGYALAGMAIEAISGEAYGDWISREILRPGGLEETLTDAPVAAGTPFANGHSAVWPLGERVVIPADGATHAIMPAGGFVSTASDLAKFFSSLDPASAASVLSVDSRREMIRRQWREPDASFGRWYGLGVMSGTPENGSWEWFGHSGVFWGTLSRTACLSGHGIAVSILTNSADGLANFWVDGVLRLIQAGSTGGGPSARTSAWTGRWWSSAAAFDLLPMRDRVMVVTPALLDPTLDAGLLELNPENTDQAKFVRAAGLASFGEPARLVRENNAQISEVWLGGTRLVSEQQAAAELRSSLSAAPAKPIL